NRIIDLSYAAAKKLGMLGRGTALVDIKAIDPLKYDKNSTSTSRSWFAKNTPPRHYGVHHVDFNDPRTKPSVYLQVGAFRNKVYAEKLKQRLLPHVSSPIHITQLSHSQKLYRVQIGPIENTQTATRLHKQLKLMGLNSRQYEMES
ncbi:MAG TPA: SPOR domain-containing protein, partial [Gammaproteobacteria bacterium]|nr:SPOR domain-containing protein [Gammaproteobacteria bacterium]